MASKSRFDIFGKISMTDKVTGSLKGVGKSVTGFSRKMRNQFKLADVSAMSINKSINKVGGRAAKIGMTGLGVGAGFVAKQFVEFDDAIFAATAKFSDLDITTKKGQKTMEELRKTARKVGADTKFNAVQAAQGLDFLAMAGFNTKQSMAALPGVVSLATVANVDLARATDIASDTLGAFNLTTKDSVQLQKNLARVNDVAAKTTTMFNTTLEGLFEAVKKGGPTFTSTGQSIETFSTLVGVMANAGVKGEESGTQLRNIMLRLAGPTDAAAGIMQKMGIRVKDSKGNFRDIIEIMDDFKKGTKGMGDVQRAAALKTVFGARAITGVNILLAEGSDKLKDYRKKLLESGGSADKMAKIIEQSMGNKIKALGSAATELGFKIFTAFAGEGKDGIDGMTKAIRKFNVKPIVDTLKVMFAILKFVFDLLGPFLPAITGIVVAIKLWATAQAALNFLMALNPLGLMVVGIVAAIAVIKLLVDNWDILRYSFQIGFQEILVGWKMFKYNAMDALSVVGMFSKQDVAGAFADSMVASINLDIMRLKRGKAIKEKGGTPASFLSATTGRQYDFSSPNSRGQNTTTTNNTQGTLNLNVNTPAGSKTDTSTSGIIDPFQLNLGEG